MTAPSKGENNMPINNKQSPDNRMPASAPPPMRDSQASGAAAPVPREDLIPYWLLIGIFAVVMALTLFLLADNWVTDMTRFRSIKAQQRGDWVAAVNHLEKLVEAGATAGNTEVSLSPTYLSELGYSHMNLKQYDKALDYYQQAQANRANVQPDDQGNPRPPYDFNGLIGVVQYRMGDLEAAKKSLLAALQHNKLDPLANFTLGEVAMKQSNYTQAADYFKVVAGNPVYEEQVKGYYAEIEKKLFAGIS